MKILILLLLISSSAFAQRPSVSRKELTGTYIKKVPGYSNINKVRVRPVGKNRLWVYFNFVRMLSEGDGNLGWIGGYATLQGDSATFRQTVDHWDSTQSTCTIGMKFLKPGVLVLSEEFGIWDSCSFGYGVSGRGIYKKVSGKRP